MSSALAKKNLVRKHEKTGFFFFFSPIGAKARACLERAAWEKGEEEEEEGGEEASRHWLTWASTVCAVKVLWQMGQDENIPLLNEKNGAGGTREGGRGDAA